MPHKISPFVEKILLTVGVTAVFLSGYYWVGSFTQHRARAFPWVFAWERELPLLPWMVFPYLLALVLPDFGLFGWPLSDRAGMRRQALSYTALHFLCFAIFLLYPVHADLRPLELPSEALGVPVLALYYKLDPPVNLFPSLHCSNAVLAALMAKKLSQRLFYIVAPLAVLVVLSVVLIKQHYVADAIAGVALGLLVDRLLGPRPPRPR